MAAMKENAIESGYYARCGKPDDLRPTLGCAPARDLHPGGARWLAMPRDLVPTICVVADLIIGIPLVVDRI